MTLVMKREKDITTNLRRALGFLAGALMVASAASAQNPIGVAGGDWRIGASTGAYVPLSSLIAAADEHDTQLEAGPAFGLDVQYLAHDIVSVYLNGTLAFSTIRLGSSIRNTVLGPSSQVMVTPITLGVLLTGTDWFGEYIEPTLRLGGGLKGYSFDLIGADNQFRPTADIGLGFRGIGLGRIEVSAEARYLLSSFDQEKLPTRGIVVQDQRQNDIFFSIGIAIRP
jgi:hypothetical protein